MQSLASPKQLIKLIMSEERKLYITKRWVIVIFIYYSILFVIGTVASFNILLVVESKETIIVQSAIIGSVAIALTASSIAYIRKLYKLCFSYASNQEEEDQLFLKRLGTIVYFLTRPIFAIAFSLLVVASLRSALLMSSPSSNEMEAGFVYICMITSFYVGFLSGEFIKKMEKNGTGKFKDIL